MRKLRQIPRVQLEKNIRKNPKHFSDIITSIEIGIGTSIPKNNLTKIQTMGDLCKIVSLKKN